MRRDIVPERRRLSGGDSGVWEGHLREHDLRREEFQLVQEAHLREHGLMHDAHAALHHEMADRITTTAAQLESRVREAAHTLQAALDKSASDHWLNHGREHDQSEKSLVKLERYADDRADETNKRFEAAIAALQLANNERNKSVDKDIAEFRSFMSRNEGKGIGQAPFIAMALSVITAVLAAAAVIAVAN